MSGYFQPGEQRGSKAPPNIPLARLLMLSLFVAAALLLLFSGTALAGPSPLFGASRWVERTFFNSTPTLAYDATLNTQDGDTITGRVAARDADGDSLTLTATTPVNGGTVFLRPDGSFIYTVPTSMHQTGGTDSFTVTASDRGTYWHLHGFSRLLRAPSRRLPADSGHDATISVALTISAVNSAPIIGAPAYTLGAPEPASGAIQGQLHVTDPDLDTLAYSVAVGPTKGVVILDSVGGSFTYSPTPAARHEAAFESATPDQLSDAFTVAVDDGQGGTALVPVSVPIDPRELTAQPQPHHR